MFLYLRVVVLGYKVAFWNALAAPAGTLPAALIRAAGLEPECAAK
jgi:hypothetical protein